MNSNKKFVRGYYQSYNFTVQRELPAGLLGSVGYRRDACRSYSDLCESELWTTRRRHCQPGLGLDSRLLRRHYRAPAVGAEKYNSLQATLNKRFSSGLQFLAAYTYSKDITMSTSILIPEYINRDYYTAGTDRTHHFVVSSTYELPFGKGKPMVTKGVGAALLSGWSLNGIFNHYSGAPFTISASSSSCNCPGNSQIADLVNPNVAKVGSGVGGEAYFTRSRMRR